MPKRVRHDNKNIMFYFILLFLEIIALFFLSKRISRALSGFLPVNLLSLVFLPGIIVHELAHLFMAAVLFVPVGNMEFAPRKIGNEVKLGSVEIARTDPIRRSIIGFAPVFAGLALIVGGVYLFSSNLLIFQNLNPYVFIVAILVLVYLLFAIANTMFSSSKDMEGAVEISIALLVIFAGAYVLGFRPQLSYLDKMFTGGFVKMIQESIVFLLAPISIDLLMLSAVKVLHKN